MARNHNIVQCHPTPHFYFSDRFKQTLKLRKGPQSQFLTYLKAYFDLYASVRVKILQLLGSKKSNSQSFLSVQRNPKIRFYITLLDLNPLKTSNISSSTVYYIDKNMCNIEMHQYLATDTL